MWTRRTRCHDRRYIYIYIRPAPATAHARRYAQRYVSSRLKLRSRSPQNAQHFTSSWGERERAPPWEFNAPPVCLSVCLYISYVRHFWSRGPRATRKRKPAHLKFKSHMHACCIYVANASRAITTLIERLHMYSSSLITSSAG